MTAPSPHLKRRWCPVALSWTGPDGWLTLRWLSKQSPATKRRRWPCLVVMIVVFVIGTTVWYCWPRVDARFVGNWRIFDANSETLIPAEVIMTISPMGWMTQTSEESGHTVTFACYSKGSQLVLDPHVRPGWAGVRSRLDNLLQRFRGEPQSDLSVLFTVQSTRHNELTIESLAAFGRTSRYVWKRITE
jgi:hypothetical protein